MALKAAESALLFDIFFLILLGSYGFSTGQFNVASTLPRIPVTIPPTQGGCVPVVFLIWPVCLDSLLGSSGLAVATENIAWSIMNIPAIIYYLLQVVLVFANLVLSVMFSPQLSPNGIPFVGLFFVFLQLIIFWEAVRTLRGSGLG